MFRRFVFALVLLGSAATVCPAQTVDDVVARSIAAHGGAAKLKSVNSLRFTAIMSMMGMDMPMVVEQKRPKMVRVDITIQGTNNTQAYDGQSGWVFMPVEGMTSAQPAPPDVLKDLEEQAELDLPYMDYQAKGNKVELAGKQAVGAVDTYKLQITLKNGEVRNYYLDAKTFLPVKTDAKRTAGGVESAIETLVGDYRDVGGMMMPHSIENHIVPSGGQTPPITQKVTIQKVELNAPIDDARFKMPK